MKNVFIERLTKFKVEPLSIPESAKLLRSRGIKGSAFEFYQLLSVLGGIPWYLEQVDPALRIDENIKKLCFHRNGLLVLEFDRIFYDLFNGKGSMYKNILYDLKEGMKTLGEIRQNIQVNQSNTLRTLIGHLEICGFVRNYHQWSLKTGQVLKLSLYRIFDPYIRFYLKYIEPNVMKIKQGAFESMALSQFPGFDTQLGLQVEYLLLQNRTLVLHALGIHEADCLFDGPYRQTKTVRTKGCQIDYLVQTRTKTIFVCEFKFKRRELGIEIIEEVQEKIRRFSIPRGYALVPVLFHIGDVSASVYDTQYFYRIIDIADMLEA
jgi:hypothetical protein